MFARRLFNHSASLMAGLVSRLIFSRWACGYEEHHGSCEDAYAAHIGPVHLEINRCFVLDHDDAFISICIPIPTRHERGWLWGKLHLGYVVCLGEDEIRRPGFYAHWQKPLPKVVYGQGKDSPDNPIPF